MPANNTTPAKLGRFQTRLSRVVDIVASHVVKDSVPGHPGKTVDRRLWTGLLYKHDMKTVDSIYNWEDSGAFSNQRGVASPNDLAIFMRELTPAELATALQTIPQQFKGTASAQEPAIASDFRSRAGVAAPAPAAGVPAAAPAPVHAASEFRKRAASLHKGH